MFPKGISHVCSSCSQKRFLWHVYVPHVPKRDSSGMSVFLMFPKRAFSMSGPHSLSWASQSYLFSCSLRVPSCSAPSCSFIKHIFRFLKGVPFSLCFFMFFHVLLGVILLFPKGSPFHVPS